MNKTHALIVLVGVAALLYLLVHQLASGTAGTAQVVVDEYVFYPDDVTVKTRGKVVWVNEGFLKHTVTFDFFGSPLLAPDDSWEHVFEEEGDYAYYSAVDAKMSGVVHVTK